MIPAIRRFAFALAFCLAAIAGLVPGAHAGAAPPTRSQVSMPASPTMPGTVPAPHDDPKHLVPAMAITLRYLFNTLAIGGFVVIVFLAGVRLLRRKAESAQRKMLQEFEHRVAAEADRNRQRSHLVSILDGLLDVYLLLDGAGRCHTIINNRKDPWWPENATEGMTIGDLFPPELMSDIRDTIARTQRFGTSQTIEFQRLKGREVGWFESRTAPLSAQGDEPARVVWIVRNISARKNAINNVRALSTKLALVEERERQKIAADLHDTIGQNLALARIRLGLLGKKVDDEETGAMIRELVQDNDESIRVIRETINELSPPALYRLGLSAAIEALAERYARRHGIAFRFRSATAFEPDCDRELKIILFRIVRELMFNVIKHSRAKAALISLTYEWNSLTVEVTDDGVGFDMGSADLYTGKSLNVRDDRFGLFTVQEAVSFLGGEMTIRSVVDEGTAIRIRVPIPATDTEGEPETAR